MKRALLLLIVLSVIALPAAAQTKRNANKDREIIKNIAFEWQDAWNRHDMDSLAALVAEDVDFVNVAGIWTKNRKEFKEFHSERHRMQFKESVWTTNKTEVKLVKPDVAVVHVEWGLQGDKDPDGTLRQPRQGIFTWVAEKQKGKWLIIAAQNTNLREPAPGK